MECFMKYRRTLFNYNKFFSFFAVVEKRVGTLVLLIVYHQAEH